MNEFADGLGVGCEGKGSQSRIFLSLATGEMKLLSIELRKAGEALQIFEHVNFNTASGDVMSAFALEALSEAGTAPLRVIAWKCM